MGTFKKFLYCQITLFFSVFGCRGQKVRDLSCERDLKLCDISRVRDLKLRDLVRVDCTGIMLMGMGLP